MTRASDGGGWSDDGGAPRPAPDGVDSEGLASWVGRTRSTSDVLTVERARKLAATLDMEPHGLHDGDPLPPGWHWIYFHHAAPRRALSEDGHERRGRFLPPVPLERRMWAGGRLRLLRPLRLGSEVERISTIRSVEEKEGRAGRLVFVTVEHRLADGEGPALEEEQDLVYLDRRPGGGEGDTRDGGGDEGSDDELREAFSADEVTLFRFSALTFNGHRIHYDRPYATRVEGYPGLVVHGPLLALVLLGAGVRWAGGTPGDLAGWRFGYRARSPVFCREPVWLCGRPERHGDAPSVALEVRHHGGGTAMIAELALTDS